MSPRAARRGRSARRGWTAALTACLLALALIAGAAEWPYPLVEAELIVTRWLERSGYEFQRSEPRPGWLLLEARRGGERRQILLQPESPLATRVQEVDDREAVKAGGERDLADLLDRHRRGADFGTLSDGRVPPGVLDRRSGVVCIRTQTREGELRLSGFVVDRSGGILTTAHGLEGVSVVTVRDHDGRELPARVARRDAERDLAHLVAAAPLSNPLDLRGARLTLEEGESVYSIGCPDGGTETVRSGRAKTAMRRVGSLVMWEVGMETLPGASGSPVFDASGRFAGVVKGRFRGDATRALVIPSETVLRFLGSR